MSRAQKFAEGTTVSSSASRAEIERLVSRYGADQFASGWSSRNAVVAFAMNGRQIRFTVPMPDPAEFKFRNQGAIGQVERTAAQREKAIEAETARRFRALVLIIKAKLEAVESGIVTFEEEFLAQTVMPNGQTVAQWTEPRISEAYAIGAMPTDLPLLAAPEHA